MSQRLNLSREDILKICADREFFVSRYRWSHDRLRKKCRRMRGEGLIMIARQDRDGWYYRAVTPAQPGCESSHR